MKTPVCKVCLTSDILCTGCESKFKNGEISEGDILLARALVKLTETHPILEHTEFKRTLSHKDHFLVIVPKGMARNFIGKQGIFIKELGNILKTRRIKIIEETTNPRELVERVLYPANLLGVNVVYSGKKPSYKVRVPNSDRMRIPDPRTLEELIEKLLNSKTAIVFE
jgi:transcription antitermination factor NusA-like protein